MKYILKIEIDFEVESRALSPIYNFMHRLTVFQQESDLEIKGIEFNFIEVNT